MKDFYNDLDLRYPEIGILLEDSFIYPDEIKEKAKIYIPILFSNSGKIVKEKVSTTSGIVSKTNYISLYIPDYLYNYYKDEDNNDVGYLPKDTELIVVFIGGRMSIDKIRIIGKIEDERSLENAKNYTLPKKTSRKSNN
jgi:hypothetical protein